MNIRAMIGALTIAALIFLAAHQNPPSRLVQTDYCVVDQYTRIEVLVPHAPIKRYVYAWIPGYAPCSHQDIYRQI